jgi:hypothetical protein
MDVDRDYGRERDRDRDRDRDRFRGDRDRDRDRDRTRDRERDGDPRGGWYARGAGEIPPPRSSRILDEDDLARQQPSGGGGSSRFQPAASRNGTTTATATATADVSSSGPRAYETRASYERPATGPSQTTTPVSAANSLAPVAQRKWGGGGSHDGTTDGNSAAAAERGNASAATDQASQIQPLPPAGAPIPERTPTESSAAPTAAPLTSIAPPPAPPPTELYERLVQVGEGTYGKVYKARNVETGGLVALKRIRMEAERDGFPVTAVREIKLLQSLRHPNVVELVEMLVAKGERSPHLFRYRALRHEY